MKVTVAIPQVYNAMVEVEVPEKATESEIQDLAEAAYTGEEPTEFSHTLDRDQWGMR